MTSKMDLVSFNTASKNNDTTRYTTTRSKNFNLNLDRAIARKLEATRRTANVEYIFTGGGITGKADAVTFELMKNAMQYYYQMLHDDETNMKVEFVKDQDKKGLVLSMLYKVYAGNKHLYTLTTYYTNCSLLVNGKDTSRFINTDLPAIHETIKQVILNGHKVNLQYLNQLLEEQLQKLNTNIQQRPDSELISNKIDEISKKDDDMEVLHPNKCKKCKRNVQTRGVFCSLGKHWIHYVCGRLTTDAIDKIENSDDLAYTCILCSDTHTNKTSNILAIHECHNSARSILSEEIQLDCAICETKIDDDHTNCETCMLSCHKQCTIINEEDEHICINCHGLAQQRKNSTQDTPESIQSNYSDNTCHKTQILEEDTYLKTLDDNNSIKLIDENTNLITNHVENQNADIEQNKNIEQDKREQLNTKEIKQSEQRQRENKLRKREEELKIRERILEETQNDKLWFQTYINKLEQRVKELERSNAILRKEIQIQNKTDPNNDHIPNTRSNDDTTSTDRNSTLMSNLHDRVSNFILRQIDKQLSNMEENFNNSNMDNPTQYNLHTPKTANKTNKDRDLQDEEAEQCNSSTAPTESKAFDSHITETPIYVENQKPLEKRQSCKESKDTNWAIGQPLFYKPSTSKNNIRVETNSSFYPQDRNVQNSDRTKIVKHNMPNRVTHSTYTYQVSGETVYRNSNLSSSLNNERTRFLEKRQSHPYQL